jgi:2-iminobutanoate/2-iminopropanoate deaminase
MSKKRIHSDKAPPAIGPYSQGILAGSFLYVSGQLPINPIKDELVSKPFSEAVHQSLRNVKSVVNAAGLEMSDVVKVTVFLKNLKNFQEFNAVYATYFPGEPPARAVVEVSALPKDAEIEIEAIAYDSKEDAKKN